MSHFIILVSWIEDESVRLNAAYWANVVTYRIFTRSLGAIGNILDYTRLYSIVYSIDSILDYTRLD